MRNNVYQTMTANIEKHEVILLGILSLTFRSFLFSYSIM